MGQSSNGQALSNGEYSVLRQTPNGSIVKQSGGRLHFLKQYSFTNQEAYQQAFVNFSKKLPEKHQHILYLERTNTKLENTFCSTFYKISLLYEYFDHTLQREIEQRNHQRKMFDQKEVWSVLCSCTLGVSQMIRIDGRSHAALSAKDIRLNEEGLVKILSLEMVGMEGDHDPNRQGSTKQLALTILNCLLMQQITNDNEDFLLDLIDSLESTAQMKSILKLMTSPATKFIELEEYLFRMVQEETDSLNSYSNTPALKDRQVKPANSYSKIYEESKEDDSLMSLTRDLEDAGDESHQQPATSDEEVPDQNDLVDDNRSKSESQQYSVRSNQSQATSPRKSKCQSPKQNFKISSNQENSLFTDPKLLNLIHSDLEEIKKRKSIAGSRKLGASESNQFLEQRTETKVLQNISNHVPSIPSELRNNAFANSKSEDQIGEFKAVNLASTHSLNHLNSKERQTQGASGVRMNGSHARNDEPKSTSSIETEQATTKSKLENNQASSNPEKKPADRKYQNIMEIQDMGFKKNKLKHKDEAKDQKREDTKDQKRAETKEQKWEETKEQKREENKEQKWEEVREQKREQKKEESRVSANSQSSNFPANYNQSNNTVVYNSNSNSNYTSNSMAFNLYQSQKERSNQTRSNFQPKQPKGELEYVTETYIRGRYEGTKYNSMRHGKGVFYYNEGGKYIGQWKENKMNGRGVLYYPNNEIAYDGEWKDDQLWGSGTLYNEEVTHLTTAIDYRNWDQADEYWIKYEGQFSEDSKNGEGKLYLSNGQIFEGCFKDDMVWGQGVLLRRDGTRLKGIWRENKLVRIN